MKSIKSIKSIIVLAIIALFSLMFLSSSLAANTAKITVETANLRESASSESKILDQVSKGEEVEVIEKTGEWYSVKHKGVSGYIQSNLLSVNNTEEKNQTNTTEVATTPQNETTEEKTDTNVTVTENSTDKYIVVEDSKLKSVPLINASDMMEVKKDASVTVLQTKNGWAYIENDASKGWIRTEKIKTEQQIKEEAEAEKAAQEAAKAEADLNAQAIKTSYVSSESVNLRKTNSTESEILSNLVQNTALEVLSEENGWTKCRVSGNVGYVSTQYLSDKKIETTSRASTTSRNSSATNTEATTSVASSGNGSSIVSIAMEYVGCSYVYGATGPNSFDCSGFTSYVYRQVGISLNRTAQAQFSNGVSVSKDELEPGDLVMFGSSTSNIYHVGIYIGGNKFVHAANASRGVTTDTLSTYSGYVGAKRVL